MSKYTYFNYLINLDNRDSFIIIKIINNTGNYFFEKKLTQNDINSFTLNKYLSFVKNCLLNKTGCTIEFNEYDDKIDMITKYETEFLDISEKITLDKFTDNDIKLLQEQNKIMCKEIKELKNINVQFKNDILNLSYHIDKLTKENIEFINNFKKIESQLAIQKSHIINLMR